MKRLLLPLLAVLALPTAVNAETVYLECKFEKYKNLIELGINPNTDQGTIRDGESTYKANQFIKSDSYSLKTNTGTFITTIAVSRIDGSATRQSEMLKEYKKIFPELPPVTIRNGNCKKKEKVDTLF